MALLYRNGQLVEVSGVHAGLAGDILEPGSPSLGGYSDYRNYMADINTEAARLRAGPETRRVLGSVDLSNAGEKNVIPRKEEVEALSQYGRARDIVASDPRARQLLDRGYSQLAGIDPASYDAIRQRIGGQANALSRRIAQGRDLAAQTRLSQMGGLNQLGRIASGADSIVARQAQMARDQAARDIASRLASTRGRYSPAAARAALMATGDASARIGAQAAADAAAERRQALVQQIAGLQGVRATDIGQQREDVVGGQGLLGYQQAGLGALAAADAQRQNLYGTATARETRDLGMLLNQPVAINAGGPSTGEQIGGLLGGAASMVLPFLFPKSDERAKRDVEPTDRGVDRFLEALDPVSWRYKDGIEDGGAKRHAGVMAQALERSDLGAELVSRGPDGLRRVDYHPAKVGPLMLASLARLAHRIDQMETRK